MKLKPAHILTVLAMVLVGCASVGTEPAQTFSQKLAYAVGVHTAVLQATTSAVEAGTVDSSDAQKILVQADQARAVLDAAKTANDAGDAAGANSKLAIGLSALTALQEYLRAHGSKS